MKFIKWKILLLTSAVCLLPILLGISLWDRLPGEMAVHFNLNNQPDNFAPKGFVVFAIPLLMMFLQAFCCFVNDINARKYGEYKKLTAVTKWIIPVMTLILQIVILFYGMGRTVDIRKAAALIVGAIFIVTGNYMPKLDRIKNYNISTAKARRINRFLGFETVIMGLLFLISIFLPPISTIICILLIIPYVVAGLVFAIKTVKSERSVD